MAARMRGYVPQRQRLPFMAALMSASVGFGLWDSRLAACDLLPGLTVATLGHLMRNPSRLDR